MRKDSLAGGPTAIGSNGLKRAPPSQHGTAGDQGAQCYIVAVFGNMNME
jgi:hypothetical protein